MSLENKRFSPEINEPEDVTPREETPKRGLEIRSWVNRDPARSPEMFEQKLLPMPETHLKDPRPFPPEKLVSQLIEKGILPKPRTIFSSDDPSSEHNK